MASEGLQGEEMSRFHAKMHLKSAPEKLNFLMEKAIPKSCPLDCSSKRPIVTHSKAVSFLTKTILCENTNILFSKNY